MVIELIRTRAFGLGMMLLCLGVSPAYPQDTADLAMASPAESGSADYRLGPADVLAVSVLGLRQFSTTDSPWISLVVSNSGKVHVPYLGVVSVNGMTPAVLEAEIARRLREQELVKDPQVTVRVADYRGQTIYVLGEVMQPGQYYMRQGMHLSDLLGLTIGFPTEGKMYLYRRAQLERAAGEDTVTDEGLAGETVVAEALEIDLNELADGTSPDMSIPLQGGDMLYVPFNKPNFFFITGEIGRPGAIEIPPSRKLLVSQAIAFAGGPSRTAKMSEGILLRYDEAGVRQELAVDFSAILRGKEPDFEILPNDIIFIPGSNAKTLGYGLLGIIPGLATRAVIP